MNKYRVIYTIDGEFKYGNWMTKEEAFRTLGYINAMNFFVAWVEDSENNKVNQ